MQLTYTPGSFPLQMDDIFQELDPNADIELDRTESY